MLLPGVEAAAGIVGEAEALAMVVDTPRAVLEGLPFEVGPPRQDEGPNRWWRFW
jgi:hypothetical protein